MGMTQTERIEVARTLMAGARLLAEYGERAGVPDKLPTLLREAGDIIESTLPPWESEPAPAAETPWCAIVPGDLVYAPNGVWYPVDSVARLDTERMSVLLVGPSGTKIPSKPKAQDKVPTRRGDAGRAVDVFRAGGLDVEVIGK